LTIKNTIGADGRMYANVDGAAPLPASVDPASLKREAPLIFYSLEDPDKDALAAMPQWMRNAIVNRRPAPEKKKIEVWHEPSLATGAKVPSSEAVFDDEIPF
jgi:hypothetical protein